MNEQDLSRLPDEELAKLAGIRLIKYPKGAKVDSRGVVYHLGEKEPDFQSWYQNWAQKTGTASDPDPDLHLYDYRLAFLAEAKPGVSPEDNQWHWPSQFKYRAEAQGIDHPNRYVDGIDTTKYQENLADESQAMAETDKLPAWDKMSDAELEALADQAGYKITERPGQAWREFVWTPQIADVAGGVAGGIAVRAFIRSFVRGLGQMLHLTGAFMESQANLPPESKKITAGLMEVGQKMTAAEGPPPSPDEQEESQAVRKGRMGVILKNFGLSIERATTPELQPEWQGLKSIFDPVYMLESGGEQLGLQAPSLISSGLAAGLATAAHLPPALTSLVVGVINRMQESAMEGGDAYESAIQKGKSPQEAAVIADKVFKNNMILTASDFAQTLVALLSAGKISKEQSNAIVKLLKFAGVGLAVGAWEAGEEGLQAAIQQSARGDKVAFDREMQEGMFWGLSMGGLFSGFTQAGAVFGERLRQAREEYLKDLRAKKEEPAMNLPPEAPPIAVPSPEPTAQVGIATASVQDPQIPTAPDIDLSDALNDDDFKARADDAANSFRGVPQEHANTVLIKAPNALGLAAAARSAVSGLFKTLKRDPFGLLSRNISAMGSYVFSEDRAWFTDGQLYVRGTPPKWARAAAHSIPPTPTAIAAVSSMKGVPTTPVYYLNMQPNFYIVSKNALPAFRPDSPRARKVVAPNVVVFRTIHDGKVYFTSYEQFRTQGIKRMFPDASFSVDITNSRQPALLATVNGELKAVLLPYRTARGAPAVYSPAPLDALVRLAGIEPETDSTEVYTLPPTEPKGEKAKKSAPPVPEPLPTPTPPTEVVPPSPMPAPAVEPAPAAEPATASPPEPGLPPSTGAPPEPSITHAPPEPTTAAVSTDIGATLQNLKILLPQYVGSKMPALPIGPMLEILKRMQTTNFKNAVLSDRLNQLYTALRFGNEIYSLLDALPNTPAEVMEQIRFSMQQVFSNLQSLFKEERSPVGLLNQLTINQVKELTTRIGLKFTSLVQNFQKGKREAFAADLERLRNVFDSTVEWLGDAKQPLIDLNNLVIDSILDKFNKEAKPEETSITDEKKRGTKRTPREEADFEMMMSSRNHPTPPTIGAMEVADFYNLDWDRLDDTERAVIIEYVEEGQVLLPDEFLRRITLDRYKQEQAGKGGVVWKTGKKFGDIIAGGLETTARLAIDPSKIQHYLIDFARALGCSDFTIDAKMSANGAFIYNLLGGGGKIALGAINSVATFAHEVGHAFDILLIGKGKTLNTLCERAGLEYSKEYEAGFLAELKEITGFFREITPELAQTQPDYVRNYRWTPVELFAMWFATNALHPEAAEQLAPNFTEAMRNRFPQLKEVAQNLRIDEADLNPQPDHKFFDPFIEAAAKITHTFPLPGKIGKVGRRMWGTKIRRAISATMLLPQWSGLFTKNPAGRKIFRAVQDNLIYFYNGTLAAALESIYLPELHSLPRDSKARIANALDHGNRQEVQKYLSSDELRLNFGLKPNEVEIYQRIITAINNSKERIRERLKLQSDYYHSDEATKAEIDARINEALEKLGGYFPIERHGPWIVWATKEETSPGEVELIDPRPGLGVTRESFYSAFENVTEANRVAELMRKFGYKDAQVYRRENLPPGFWDRFHKMSTWDLENLVEQAGANRNDPNVQMMLKVLKTRSPLDKHFIQRRWVPGYKVDFDDMMFSLESFIESTTRRLAAARARYEAKPWIARISPKTNPEQSVYYNHFIENAIYGSSTDFVHIRQGISLATLALSTTFALQQILQNVFTLWPYIGNRVGKQKMDLVFTRSMLAAFKYLAARIKGQPAAINPTLSMLLDKAITEHVVSGQYMQSLLGPGRDRARNILDALHFIAIGTEFWNRLHAACAGYILATEYDGETSPLDIYESMKDAVESASYVYGKTNMPELVAQAGSVRGFVKVAYLFKATHLNYLHEFAYMMAKGTPKAKMRMLTGRAIFLGAKRVLPFGIILWPVVRAVGRALFKKDPEQELLKARASENPMVEALAQYLSYGIGGWARLDLSDMLDLGTIISPGFDPFGQLVGPAYSMGERLNTAQKLIRQRRFAEAFAQIPFRMLSTYLTAELWRKEGKEVQKDLYMKFTDAEIRGKRLGFTPARLKEQYEVREMQRRIESKYKDIQQRAYAGLRAKMGTTEGRQMLVSAAHGDIAALYKALGENLVQRIARHNAEVHEALTVAYMTSSSPIPESVAMRNYKQYTISPADTLRWVQEEIKGKVRFETLPAK